MNRKQEQIRSAWIIAGGVIIVMLLGQVTNLRASTSDLKYELRQQDERIRALEIALEELSYQDKIVRSSSYNLREYISGQPLLTYEIALDLNPSFDKALTLYYALDGSDTWSEVPMTRSLRSAQALLTFDASKNYVLKIGFEDRGTLTYEELPLLNLYDKEDHSWASDVQLTKVKGNKIDYNVQVTKWVDSEVSQLEGALCQLYYGDKLIDEFEILERMAAESQSKPRAILKRGGGPHWFVKRNLVIEGYDSLELDQLRLDLSIHNDMGNVFHRTYEMSTIE